jgi:hypothetical protein
MAEGSSRTVDVYLGFEVFFVESHQLGVSEDPCRKRLLDLDRVHLFYGQTVISEKSSLAFGLSPPIMASSPLTTTSLTICPDAKRVKSGDRIS